jgi:hypothetical protein
MGIFRAAIEGLRATVAIPRYSLARPPQSNWWTYWFWRFLQWFFSLRVPLLTGFDTFVNLIQGKNQTMTRVFADTIIDQQRNVIRVADTIRKDLTRLLATPVRVNISVLSADQSSVFYISRSAGSAKLTFNKRSVAWVSVFTGEIRWWECSWKQQLGDLYKEIVLFDNSKGVIAGDEEKILLVSHYQPRHEDYAAFVVFPVPWPQRGFGSDYIKGAIHISFDKEGDFEKL